MKKKLSVFCSLLMTVQTILSMAVMPARAEGESGIGQPYTAPAEAPTITYNMNLDWKFYEVPGNMKVPVRDAWTVGGQLFYEKDFDDSAWETVSIPHSISAEDAFSSAAADAGGGRGRLSVLLYRKTFTVPQVPSNGKIFFELEGIRQAAYVWVNGREVGYYEAGITAMGFDLTDYVTPGEEAVIAICNDGSANRGNADRVMTETKPGEQWASATGSGYQWNTQDFNEAQIGLVYDAYLHIKGGVYQTLPLYNNLKTTGNYIYADNFNIRGKTATIHVDTEIRNESAADGNYSVEVAIVDHEGKLTGKFESGAKSVPKAADAGNTFKTVVKPEVYEAGVVEGRGKDAPISDNSVGLTDVETVDVTHIEASATVKDLRFWSTEDPYLYTVYTILRDKDGRAVDVQKKETGFRKVTYNRSNGILINDKPVWLTGYAQRSTNEWAVIGIAPDWLQDWDMELMRDGNNANFIRWMHVAPKPAEVRSSDKYGVAIACPAGDKEGTAPDGRQWSQRTEAMRDTMIYFRNSPSVIFWETGNSPMGSEAKANEMADLRNKIDPYGMRFIGARSTTAAKELNYEYNYAGTMCAGPDPGTSAIGAMTQNGIYGPIMETEYARDEAPRRVWDDYSPPDYDYINKYLGDGASKLDEHDVWDHTQESITVSNVKAYANDFYANRAGQGKNYYSAAAMMVWSDSNMHGRNSGTENDRTSGRVDAIRQTKEMYEGTRVAQSEEPAVHIIGHWSYPEVRGDTYNYYNKASNGTYEVYDTSKTLKRDPTKKTVYVIGSEDVKKVELYRIDGDTETLIGTDETPDSTFVYEFANVDVTQGDGVIAKAYNARGALAATDEIARTGDAYEIKLTPVTSDEGWRADGSDIMFFDVEVVDKNGNVCPLNYDRIDFTIEGDRFGTYMGGYNSGTGRNCFQSTDETGTMLSKYFTVNGVKFEGSTLYSQTGEKFVFAENGTNRIFVKATRSAGTFTLNASMYGGTVKGTMSVTSTAAETTGGLTTQMSSTQSREVGDPPVEVEVAAMYPLQLTAKIFNRSDFTAYVKPDTNVYYDVKVNGISLNLAGKLRARLGTQNMVFGPITPVLDALNISYNGGDNTGTISFTGKEGHSYTVTVGSNFIVNNNTGEMTEITQEPQIINGKMFVSLAAVLDYLDVKVEQKDAERIVNITKAQ